MTACLLISSFAASLATFPAWGNSNQQLLCVSGVSFERMILVAACKVMPIAYLFTR
jgi:hypothetical protein